MIGFVKIKKFWFQHVDFSWNEKLHFIFSSDSLSQEPLLHSTSDMDNTVTLLLGNSQFDALNRSNWMQSKMGSTGIWTRDLSHPKRESYP